MIHVTGGCALERMRESARRSRATRNRTYFLIQTLMNPSLAPLRAVRRALDVSVLVIASQSRVTRLRPFRLACSVSCASPSARVARAARKRNKTSRRRDKVRKGGEKGFSRPSDGVGRRRGRVGTFARLNTEQETAALALVARKRSRARPKKYAPRLLVSLSAKTNR